jgi:glycosyltransferase involved in cell wall biosynthesis
MKAVHAMTDIICFPDETWDAALWTNRQHMMQRLARHGSFRVLYINPPAMGVARRMLQQRGGSSPFVRAVEPGLWLLNMPLPLPNRLLRNRAAWLYDYLVQLGVQAAAHHLRFEQPIIWSYSPFVASYLPRLNRRLLIYDCVDRYPQLAYYAARGAHVAELDHEMTSKADVVLCTSHLLYEEKRAHNLRCHMVGNAADVALFARARQTLPIPADLRGVPRPIIGFHGSLDTYRIDYSLLLELAQARRDWSLVLVGPQKPSPDLEALAQQPNVFLPGPKALADLPAYVAQYDVGILPYRLTEYVRGLSPLKLYEYLAAGKPVVSVPVPHMTGFDVVRIAASSREFTEQIAAALAEQDDAALARRIAVAEAHSWDAKLQRILQLVPELMYDHPPILEVVANKG